MQRTRASDGHNSNAAFQALKMNRSRYLTPEYYSAKRRTSSTRTKALLALAWVSIIWGTTWVASRAGVMHMPALEMSGIRQTIAGFLFIVYFTALKHQWPRGPQWRVILVSSILNFILSNGLSTWGVKYISGGLGSIISAIFPLWLVIILMFRGRTLPLAALFGILLGFGGVCIIFYEHLHDFNNPDFKFGICLSLIATVTWAFGTLYIKKQANNFNPYFSVGFQMAISGITLFSVSMISGTAIPFAHIPAISWWSIAYLVIFGSITTFAFYIYSLRHLPAALASVYAYINPVVAVLLGSVILNEKLTWFLGFGAAITLTGVYLVNNSLKEKPSDQSSVVEPVM